MIGPLLGVIVGLTIGSGTTAAIYLVAFRNRRCPDPEAHELSEADREQIAAEFAQHASSARRAVGEYADLLAGGDRVLRKQLRLFEAGDRA